MDHQGSWILYFCQHMRFLIKQTLFIFYMIFAIYIYIPIDIFIHEMLDLMLKEVLVRDAAPQLTAKS